MHPFLRSFFFALLALFAVGSAEAQTALGATTLSAAITSTTTRQFALASTTGMVAGQTILFVDNESMPVEQVLNASTVVVQRGGNGTRGSGHVLGAGVLFGPAVAFVSKDPQGACTAGAGVFQYAPVVNLTNGLQWLCGINGRVGPGFGNTGVPPNSTTLVASAAGAILPSGPLFHVNGTAVVTGFTLPVGFDPKAGETLTVIADAIFSWTAAGNIGTTSALSLTGGVVIVGKAYQFDYDPNTGKFYVVGS